MSKTKFIYVFRHGETDYNKQGRFQGHIDNPLNQTGLNQASRLIEPLRAQEIQTILSSDLKRAVQSAQVVADELDLDIETDDRLREANLGEAEGKTRKEIEEQFGAELVTAWKSNDPKYLKQRYPNGETGEEVIERVIAGMEEYLVTTPHDRIGLASHGGVIRRLVHHIAKIPDQVVPIPNGILYGIKFSVESRSFSLLSQLKLKP